MKGKYQLKVPGLPDCCFDCVKPFELSEPFEEAAKVGRAIEDKLIRKARQIIAEKEAEGWEFAGVDRDETTGEVFLVFKPPGKG